MLAAAPLRGADQWNQPPIRYAATEARDPASKLAKDLAEGRWEFTASDAPGRVREVLAKLGISESSQVLVFSKTSAQNDLIGPANPRALWFSENAYAGWVPGGVMEVIGHDPALGPVFHTIDISTKDMAVMERDTDSCFSCHAAARTQDVPGVFVRSVFPAADGKPIGSFGSAEVDDTTPLPQRWGGYFVTGSSSLPHLGNRTFDPKIPPAETTTPQLADLTGKIDPAFYPRLTSDVVTLLVLEHQTRIHNLFTAADHRYRRAAWMARLFDAKADPDKGPAGRGADDDARGIVDALLFKNAATLGDGVEGDENFQKEFFARFPKTKNGDSLADFHLGERIFINRCSYMVYSHVFSGLPQRVKSAIVARLKAVLENDADKKAYSYLGEKERARIVGILRDTWPAYTGT